MRPYFDYCSDVWDVFGEIQSKRLQKLQNRAARIISNLSNDVDHSNKGDFRSRPISAFVYIFVLDQSGCWKAKIVNKTSEKISPSSGALVQVKFKFFGLKPKYYDRTHENLNICRGDF